MSGMQAPLDAGTDETEQPIPVNFSLRRGWGWLASKTRKNNQNGRRSHFGLIITLVMLLMVAVFLIPLSVVFIGPGNGGVLWKRFAGGTQFQTALGQGFQLIWPWDRIYIYNLRLQQWHEDLYALTSDGLSLSVEVAARYRLSADNLAYLQDAVGPDYVAKVISPQVGAAVRKLIALYPVESLLGPLRNQVQEVIFNTLTDRNRLNEIGALDAGTGSDRPPIGLPPPDDRRTAHASRDGLVNVKVNTLNRPLILLQDLLISRIVMPESVQAAINAKLEEAQHAQEYNYRLAAERDEAERQAIKAEGIRRFEDIVGRNLTQGYLTLRGIEATQALALSSNAKVIVVGGNQGLPLILNTGDGTVLGNGATGPGVSPAKPAQPPTGILPAAVAPKPAMPESAPSTTAPSTTTPAAVQRP
ncbi:MAG TPA: prohibitin family protein [Rhodopila sp.]|jgi:regulator of protease activity HflC (stomatin/prohibitin superfamily)|nr:prohibitin family protein [Rhodopila sp.]